MTLLCTPILGDDPDAMLADAALARAAGADVVEFRVDRLFSGEGDEQGLRDCLRLVRETPVPCIVTCRPVAEGGEYDGDDAARISLFERLGAEDRPPRWIDVELDTYARSANLRQKVHLAVQHPGQLRDLRTSLILSTHDFQGRPADLLRRVARLRAEPAAAVHKIAFMARSVRDNLELFDLLAERDRPTIALAMGEAGLPSRVLAPKFGGFLTFAPLRPAAATAPGQPTLDEVLNLYRFRSISATTRVYGVIGWPVAHSRSPLLHNAGFHAPGVEHDAVYLPLPVAPEWEPFKATVGALADHPALDFRGASVTIPHKANLLRLARERGWSVDPLALRAGAANTLAIGVEGAAGDPPAAVRNTDGPAAADALQRAMGWLQKRRVAVLGAGGAARGVVASLLEAGATVAVYARTREQAEALVAAVHDPALPPVPGRAVVAPWDKRCGSCAEAFINCTPLGMLGGPAPEASPIPPDEVERMAPGTVVMDTVYTPIRTPLLEAALDHGLPTVDGAAMFAGQARLQFLAWTGVDPPPGLFERLARGG